MSKQETMDKYSVLKKQFIFVRGLFFFSFIINLTSDNIVWYYINIVALLIYGAFYFVIYKCPSCKGKIGSGWSIKNCKTCGVKLN